MNTVVGQVKSGRSAIPMGLRAASLIAVIVMPGCTAEKGQQAGQIVVPSTRPFEPAVADPNWSFLAPHAEAPADFQTISKVAETDRIHVGAQMGLNNSLARPVALKMTLENRRNEDIFFDSSDYEFELFDEQGQAVPRTELGQQAFWKSCHSDSKWRVETPGGASHKQHLRFAGRFCIPPRWSISFDRDSHDSRYQQLSTGR